MTSLPAPSPASPPQPRSELPFSRPPGAGRPALVFAVVATAVFISTLDTFVVNLAIPAIQAGFGHADVAGVSWVLTGYAIAFATFLVPAGRLGDILGRRRVFAAGLAAFGLGSALCTAAPSLWWLVAARVLQGAGAAALTPTSLGLLLPSLPPARRAAAIGGWAALGAVGAASGPPLGGLLTGLGWHWIFAVNVPLVVVALVGTYLVLPEIRDPSRPPLPDGVGTAALALAVSCATLALVQGPAWDWDGRVVACVAVAVAAGIGFVLRSRSHPAPVLDLSILRVPAFALASASAALFFAAFSALLLGNVLFLTGVWHYSVLSAGVALTPGPLAAAAIAPFAGRLAQRVGPGPVGGAGALVFGAGTMLAAALLGLEPAYWSRFLPAMLLTGSGVGLALPAFTIAATATLGATKLATGIGAQTMFRQVGATFGIAAFAAILGTPTAATVVDSFTHVRWFIAIAAAAAAAALLLIRAPRRRLQPQPAGAYSAS